MLNLCRYVLYCIYAHKQCVFYACAWWSVRMHSWEVPVPTHRTHRTHSASITDKHLNVPTCTYPNARKQLMHKSISCSFFQSNLFILENSSINHTRARTYNYMQTDGGNITSLNNTCPSSKFVHVTRRKSSSHSVHTHAYQRKACIACDPL